MATSSVSLPSSAVPSERVEEGSLEPRSSSLSPSLPSCSPHPRISIRAEGGSVCWREGRRERDPLPSPLLPCLLLPCPIQIGTKTTDPATDRASPLFSLRRAARKGAPAAAASGVETATLSLPSVAAKATADLKKGGRKQRQQAPMGRRGRGRYLAGNSSGIGGGGKEEGTSVGRREGEGPRKSFLPR